MKTPRKLVSLRLSELELGALQATAKRLGVSMSEHIRRSALHASPRGPASLVDAFRLFAHACFKLTGKAPLRVTFDLETFNGIKKAELIPQEIESFTLDLGVGQVEVDYLGDTDRIQTEDESVELEAEV